MRLLHLALLLTIDVQRAAEYLLTVLRNVAGLVMKFMSVRLNLYSD